MATIYVTSTETFSGKSALCVGLGKRFLRDGFTVGYMKPVSTVARKVKGRVIDEDAEFIKQTLNLPDSLETIAPVILTPQIVEAVLKGEEKTDFAAVLQKAFAEVTKGSVSNLALVLYLPTGVTTNLTWIKKLCHYFFT